MGMGDAEDCHFKIGFIDGKIDIEFSGKYRVDFLIVYDSNFATGGENS